MVLALGRTDGAPGAPEPPPATDDFRTLPGPLPLTLLVLSRLPARGLDDGVLDMCSFCWCLKSRSRRAKHLVHSAHSKGFSFVWERSWRFRCSNLANDLEQVPQTWGLGLSVFGGGKFGFWVVTVLLDFPTFCWADFRAISLASFE
jgi:hypothetical protein